MFFAVGMAAGVVAAQESPVLKVPAREVPLPRAISGEFEKVVARPLPPLTPMSKTGKERREYFTKADAKAAQAATRVWDYLQDGSIYSPYCSSAYEDRKNNYLIGYSLGGPLAFTEIVGVNAQREKVFDYSYPVQDFCETDWNAVMIHLENMAFQ